jgi:hypothetical protein
MTTGKEPTPQDASARFRAVLEQIRSDAGGDQEIVRLAAGEFFALERQNSRNHFEGRLEYARQVHEHRHAAMRGLVEYGLQTLKWSFLLNAGAIAVVMAYVGGVIGKSTDPSTTKAYVHLILEIWPFVVGCVLATLAGAAAFFNFSYAEGAIPSSELLHNFLAPDSARWPLARLQKTGETPEDFSKRFAWKIDAWRTVAISLGIGSAAFFALGVILVMRQL